MLKHISISKKEEIIKILYTKFNDFNEEIYKNYIDNNDIKTGIIKDIDIYERKKKS